MNLPKPSKKFFAISELIPNGDNDRFMPGTVVDGIEMPDTLNIGAMEMAIVEAIPGIKEAGDMPEDLVIELMPDGRKIVLQGNRRTIAGQKLDTNPATPQGVKEKLQKVPCVVYTGLDSEQRDYLIHDKKSQGLSRSEIVRQCWIRQSRAQSFSTIAMDMYPLLATYTGQGFKKFREVSAIVDYTERKKEVLDWLRGTLDQKILLAGRLGKRVRQAFMAQELINDGLVSADDKTRQPYFNVGGQKRLGDLLKIKEEEKDVWTTEDGSPKFNAKIEEFHNADYPALNDKGEVIGADGKAVKKTKLMTKEALERQQKDHTSSATVKAAYALALGTDPLMLPELDAKCYLWEQATAALLRNRDKLPEPMKSFATHLVDGTDAKALAAWIDGLATQG